MYGFATKLPTFLPNKFHVASCGKVSCGLKTVKKRQKRHDKYSLFCIQLFNRCYYFLTCFLTSANVEKQCQPPLWFDFRFYHFCKVPIALVK
jgi:hypothetical protein